MDLDWRQQSLQQDLVLKDRTLQQIRIVIDDMHIPDETKLMIIDRLLRVAGYGKDTEKGGLR